MIGVIVNSNEDKKDDKAAEDSKSQKPVVDDKSKTWKRRGVEKRG